LNGAKKAALDEKTAYSVKVNTGTRDHLDLLLTTGAMSH
jgi:hypothetical protein